jgi:hypothetical protein
MLCIQRTRNHGVFPYYRLFFNWSKVIHPGLESGRIGSFATHVLSEARRPFRPQELISKAACLEKAKYGQA